MTFHKATLDVNGTTSVPLGMFGTHAVALTPALIADMGVECNREIHFTMASASKHFNGANAQLPVFIDCLMDRFQPPMCLERADWKPFMAAAGKAFGEFWKAKADPNRQGIVQLWNEPYLNWAERSAGDERASTINQKYYDVGKAVEGGPVTVLKTGQVLSHFKWRGLWPVRYEDRTDKKTGKVSKEAVVGFSIAMPPGAKPGDRFDAPETRYWRGPGKVHSWTVEQRWYPVDPTMVSFWSGRQNLELYSQMHGAWAAAVRAANSKTIILAGWDYGYDMGNWAVWKELCRPLLKEHPTLIDGLTEHHYGIPVELIQAGYEVAATDSWAITGRALTSWNTETQGVLDPAVYGRVSNANQPDNRQLALWEARYNAADIVGLIARMPDKARSRTIHRFAPNFAACGGAEALRLLKPLRGELLALSSSTQSLWAAGARTKEGHVVVALTNGSPLPMQVTLDGFASAAATLTRTVADPASGVLSTAAVAMAGEVRIDSRETVLVTYKGAGGAATAKRTRMQFHPKQGALAEGPLSIDLSSAGELAQAQLRLRVSVTGPLDPATGILQPGAATITVAGQTFRHDGRPAVQDFPLEAGSVTAAMAAGTLTVTATADAQSTVAAASVLVER